MGSVLPKVSFLDPWSQLISWHLGELGMLLPLRQSVERDAFEIYKTAPYLNFTSSKK